MSKAKYRMRLEQDPEPDSPREWDESRAWIVTTETRHFNVQPKGWTVERAALISRGVCDICHGEDGKEGTPCAACDGENPSAEDARLVAFPLRAYVHSGVALSLGASAPFNCPWDSGVIGFVVVDPGECGGTPEAEAAQLVETWNQYLSGDVWGWIVERMRVCDMGHEHAEQVDSCWGCYGEDYAKQQGEEALEFVRKGEVTT